MEKVGVSNQEMHDNLRNEEATLMQRMSKIMTDPAKTAADRTEVENRLSQVRAKLTELDGAAPMKTEVDSET
jgi:hypothetical protein